MFAGSTCKSGLCTPVAIATGQTSPDWLLVNSGTVFWINETAQPAVTSINEDGSQPGYQLPIVSPGTPGFVLFDSGPTAYVYWNDAAGSQILLFGPIGAFNVEQPIQFVSQQGVSDVTELNDEMYLPDPNAGGILDVGADGIYSNVDTPVYAGMEPIAIAADSAYLYWTDLANGPGTGSISKAPLPVNGAATGSVTHIGTNLSPVNLGRTLAVNATNAYLITGVISNSGRVQQVPIGGGTATALSSSGNAASVAADASGVYWVDSVAGKVFKVATGTTTIVTLATGQAIQNVQGGLAVDARGVYWTTSTQVMALAK